MLKYYALWVLFMSVLDFSLMGADKRLARLHRRRVPERVLLGLAAVGGSFGGFLGMRLFRHKTKHPRFYIALPLLMLLHLALGVLIYLYGPVW